ncbi:hypothetical protein PILCRDRAFT_1931 [Piloderma croceum F 1598]|uniref:Uncharacterized protein n=1 Tax=Piloderma croceum (strain F 1598) TaxID=765440 RepID=A0A0C3CIM3_PILCF|nr:hypothetical protein PILCRDRAFT_1931 [Piloderma croceum F 1598]
MPKVSSTKNSADVPSIFLAKISAQQLHSHLRQVTQSRNTSETDVDALLTALNRLGISMALSHAAAKDNTLMHCVRCHKEYLERENGMESCKIEHNWEDGIHWGNGCRYQCESCGEYIKERSPGYGFDNETMCFTSTHTTDVDDVDFEEISADTCEENGCKPNNSQESVVKAEGKH